MKYIISLIVITGLSVGIYFLQQERPDCGAIDTKTNQCAEVVELAPAKSITNLNELSY